MHYIRLLNCQCLKQCVEDTTFVCGGGKPILHVCFIVSFSSEWFLLLECIEKKAPIPLYTVKLLKGTRGLV